MEFNPSSNFLHHHHTHHQIHHYHPSPTPPTSNFPFYPPPQQDQIFINNNHHHHHFSEYDQKLIDEVIYLHTLWHRGPPNPFHPLHQQDPYFNLKPCSSTPIFKKKSKKNKKLRKTQLGSGKEWPVGPTPTCPSPPGSGWAPFRPALRPSGVGKVSGEEVARVSALKVQLKGLDACMGLFSKKSDGGDDGDDDDDDDDEEEYGDDCDEELELMWKVFEGNDELRGYYEKNCWDGEFYCLVCGVIGGKFGRKYKNCLALVQHSVSILRTKKKKVHRGYAYVVCKVLGWDINNLPSLPPSNCDGIDKSLEKSYEVEGEANKHADGCDGNPNGVGAEVNLAKTNDCQPEQKEVANDVGFGIVSCTDEGCNSDNQVHSESEKNTNADALEEETHNSVKRDGVCTSIEHGQSEQQNPSVSNPIDDGGDDDVKQSSGDVERGVTDVEAH